MESEASLGSVLCSIFWEVSLSPIPVHCLTWLGRMLFRQENVVDLAFRGSKSISDLFVSLDLFPHKGAAKGRAPDMRKNAFRAGKRRGFGFPELKIDFRLVCLT